MKRLRDPIRHGKIPTDIEDITVLEKALGRVAVGGFYKAVTGHALYRARGRTFIVPLPRAEHEVIERLMRFRYVVTDGPAGRLSRVDQPGHQIVVTALGLSLSGRIMHNRLGWALIEART